MRCFSILNWGKSIKHHWVILMLTFLLICGVGITTIWLVIEPLYSVTGAIMVAPILENIVTGEADRGGISNYQSFMNTQAEIITSKRVVLRVADDLMDKNLSFFEDESVNLVTKLQRKLRNTKTKSEPATILKRAIDAKIIAAAFAPGTELVKLTMKSPRPEEAKQIVDAFINAYMAIEVSSATEEHDRKLRLLESEQSMRAANLQSLHQQISEMAQHYGTTDLVSHHDMRLQRVKTLLDELTKVEARRIKLEAQVQLLEQSPEQTIGPEELLKMRNEYINSDPAVQELTRNIIKLDCELIIAKQGLAAADPAIEQKEKLLLAFQSRLKEKSQEVSEQFDTMASKEISNAGREKVRAAKTELEQTKAHENHLRQVLTREDTQTVELGHTQLKIQNLKFKFDLDKEIYDTITRRIDELQMERKRPARVSVAYYADIASIRDKRITYTIILIFSATACGMLLAFLREKAE